MLNTSSPTTFYSASAGSGKTYTLARDYLTILFKQSFNNGYRRILAVTFTNKAVAEMKERILKYLYGFTLERTPEDIAGVKQHIQSETNLDDQAFIKKAQRIYRTLLHDYAAFDIVTLDAFSHRVLRTFSKDIELPDGFEVEMDVDNLMSKAVNRLLARAGNDKALTQILVDFSLLKIDDGRSWNIEYDLLNISKLLTVENNLTYLKELREYDLNDFNQLKSRLLNKTSEIKAQFTSGASKLIEQANSLDLAATDFAGKSRSPFNWIIKIAMGYVETNPEASFLNKFIDGAIYSKSMSDAQVARLTPMEQPLREYAQHYVIQLPDYLLFNNVLKNIVPLSLLNQLQLEIDSIKNEERIVPIYEFNGLLSSQVKDEPAPFIYERLGEKYRHYFIDEFQDTSTMQWRNLEPLIENAVSQQDLQGKTGSLMIVGDAKQAIYRWRGGNANQFLELFNEDSLFNLAKSNKTLPVNYRSQDNIITFNNGFFDFYGSQLIDEIYRDLYKNQLQQESNHKTGGYVQLDIIDTAASKDMHNDEDNPDPLYAPHVLRQINHACDNGALLSDIAILVRTNKQGHELAQYLSDNNIPIISADSLLVHASARVQLLVSYLEMILSGDQPQARYNLLLQYHQVFEQDNLMSFISQHLKISIKELHDSIMSGEDDVYSAFAKAELFQSIQLAASDLNLFNIVDNRLQAFMEFAYTYSTNYEVSLSGFIEHWYLKQSSLSVPPPVNVNAVQISTIHKSKGLAYNVVIAPYCDVKYDDMKKATGWVALDNPIFKPFKHGYISLDSKAVHYPGNAPVAYHNELAQSQMDHINTLYVAFTRAVNGLYISCKKPGKTSSSTTYASLLIDFFSKTDYTLNSHTDYESYSNGVLNISRDKESQNNNSTLGNYSFTAQATSLEISTKSGTLWITQKEEAIIHGTELHKYLAEIKTLEDIEKAIARITQDEFLYNKDLSEYKSQINTILNTDAIRTYFATDYAVFNERTLLVPDAPNAIPDKLLIKEKQVIIIDYKTGERSNKHVNQLEQYANLLEEMKYVIEKMVLIYTDTCDVISWSRT